MISVNVHHIWFCLALIRLSGDIEENPCPKRISNQSFSICHWNLWRRDVVVITTAQLHSTKPELRFCAGSNPAGGVSEIRDGEDL